MPKRILFVDDEPDILRVAVFRLKQAGHEIITAVDGRQAWDLTQKIMPDLIFLDIQIPFMNGIEICMKIKSDQKLKNIPVILFTASVQDIEERTKQAGANDYLIKPFSPQQLLEKTNKFIG